MILVKVYMCFISSRLKNNILPKYYTIILFNQRYSKITIMIIPTKEFHWWTNASSKFLHNNQSCAARIQQLPATFTRLPTQASLICLCSNINKYGNLIWPWRIKNQDLNIQNYFIREPFDPTLLRWSLNIFKKIRLPRKSIFISRINDTHK